MNPEPTVVHSLRPQREALLALMLDRRLLGADLVSALRMLTEACADLVGAERVGVWLYDEDYSTIRCLDLFERRSRQHGEGEILRATASVQSVSADERGLVFAVTDVRSDPRVSEFKAYFDAHDIRALLNAPVWSGERIHGLFGLERTAEPHAWSVEDEELCVRMATMAALCFEIDDHRQALVALRESEASLERAQALAGVGSWDLDVPTGRGRWSREMFRLFRFDPAADTPTLDEFMSAVHPDDRGPLRAVHERVIETGERGLAEFRSDPARGPVRCFTTVIEPVRGPSGRVDRLTGAVQEITERKRLESQLLRAQRLESIGTLASGVAHDLNNVLSPIVMGVEMLSATVEDAETRNILATMQESARRGTDTIRQLLTFARGTEPQKRALQPRQLVDELDRLLQQTFPKNIRVYTECAGTPAPVLADSSQLHQVLMNLCVNARDAMPDGGVLFLALEGRTLDVSSAAIHPKARPVPYVVFKVSDSGTGIPPEILDRVFDPFFTTKSQGQGTGMGLATVLGIVEGHGGFVLVDSRVGEGTTFQVFIPASGPAQPPGAREETPAVPGGRGELILVVDDEPAILRVAENVLRRRGYSTLAASSASEALERFEQNRARVRAVLTDIMMPFGDGRQLIRTLRREDPRLPVIAMSGMASAEAREETMAGGASAFLGKPFTADELLAILNEMLSRGSA